MGGYWYEDDLNKPGDPWVIMVVIIVIAVVIAAGQYFGF
jgi:hypothetical protein